jgi:hypothetical protein
MTAGWSVKAHFGLTKMKPALYSDTPQMSLVAEHPHVPLGFGIDSCS